MSAQETGALRSLPRRESVYTFYTFYFHRGTLSLITMMHTVTNFCELLNTLMSAKKVVIELL